MSSAVEPPYGDRRQALLPYLKEQNLDAVLLVDLEGQRSASVRYLCGNPRDALLIVTAAGRTVLVPWDVHLAEKSAAADRVVPFTDYGRSLAAAAGALLGEEGGTRIEVSEKLTYPQVCALKQVLPGTDVVCRQGGLDARVLELRLRKDPGEIAALRRACEISDSICGELPELLASGPLPECELAAFIERRARERGAEGLGFEILAASPERSFAIHAFPAVTSALFGGPGLSLLDFGIRVEGYTSDVTVTVARGKLSSRQEKMVNAVAAAYELALNLIWPGASPADVARSVDELLAARGFHMPHSLGHGIGLEAHEPPLLRASGGASPLFAEDMVIALEPGLYDPRSGGVRWENDLLLTPRGAEPLTHTAILRLD